MFIQVIEGRVLDEAGVRRQLDRWERELRPGAPGFLGSTGGITGDGRFVLLARFTSRADAMANSDRPEQGAWWKELEACLAQPSFHDSEEVVALLGGGSDAAGFVQVMRGRVLDRDALAAIGERTAEFEGMLRRDRPDILGDVMALHDDGSYTEAVYLSSEEEAREGESRQLPEDAEALMGEFMAVLEPEEYLDLTQPWLR